MVITERPTSNRFLAWVLCVIVILSVGFHYWSLDGLDGLLLGLLFGDDTEYSTRYTDRSFRRVKVGMSQEAVRELLGSPLIETWHYRSVQPPGCLTVTFGPELVVLAESRGCAELGIQKGMQKAEATARLKPPEEVWWHFSRSPGSTHYRYRGIGFVKNHVVEKLSQWQAD